MARTIGKNSTLKLYKFIPFKYVKRILANGRMPIGRIDAWEDSYENYFMINNKKVDLESVIVYMDKNKTFYLPKNLRNFIELK